MSIETLLTAVLSSRPNADLERIRRAFVFAQELHGEEKRLSGEPYISHPLAVAHKLAKIRLDEDTIVAALLHDVRENSDVRLEEIEKRFGPDVAFLVEGVTKLGKLKYRGLTRYVESLRKMFIAMAHDLRVIIIKFADRIHNLETLEHVPKNKQLRIARESLEIYAPIANRLGIGTLRDQLEDLSFRYVHPKEYAWVKNTLDVHYAHIEESLERTRGVLEKELRKDNVPVVSMHGRKKHLYSLWKKLNRPEYEKDLSRVYDLIALRLVVPSVQDCYAALGTVHRIWKPLKGRIKDYIAQPKPNGYRSLHTTVFGEGEHPIEIQIRDRAMHEYAEYGVAAHWHYAEAEKPKTGAATQPEFGWVEELAKWKEEFKDDKEYLEALKINVFQNQIFAFTPKGDVIELPEDATPIDFAYQIHTTVGDTYAGAKVNDAMARFDTKLKNGDVVEILTEKNRKRPSEDWLRVVKTQHAREAIKRGLHRGGRRFFWKKRRD